SVRFLVDQSRLRGDLRGMLRRVPDIDRALSRLALDRGGPRDLAAIRGGVEAATGLAGLLAEHQEDLPDLLRQAEQDLVGHAALAELLDRGLVAEPALLARDGGLIAAGFVALLDEVRELRDEGRGVIARMQAEFIEQTGIASLKIKHNNVLGYFVDVTTT